MSFVRSINKDWIKIQFRLHKSNSVQHDMCVWHCILSAYQIAWRYEKCYNDNMVLNFDPYVCLNSFKVQNIVKNFDRNREIETILREIIVFTKTTFSFTYRSNYKKKKSNLPILQLSHMQQKIVKMKSVGPKSWFHEILFLKPVTITVKESVLLYSLDK